MVTTISTIDDYNKNHERLIGKFGEVVHRSGKSLVATRDPPMWAKEKIHKVIWDCEEMIRWEAPEEIR